MPDRFLRLGVSDDQYQRLAAAAKQSEVPVEIYIRGMALEAADHTLAAADDPEGQETSED